MSGTVLVKSPTIVQGNNFTVTAPSGLVPGPAFYDGTEVVTVSGGNNLPASAEFNTKVIVVKGVSPDDIGFIHGLYQDSNYIYLLGGSLIKDGSLLTKNLCVTRYNKTSYVIERYEHSIGPVGSDTIASGIGIGIDGSDIHFLSSNVVGSYSGTSFNTSTLSYTDYGTVGLTFTGSYISGTGTRTNSPGNTHFEGGYYSNTITYGSYTIQGIFRFRYGVASGATTKYVAGEGYISSIINQQLPIGGIYPGYQLGRNIFFAGGSANFENRFQGMAQYGSNMIYFFLYRYDYSDDFTTVYPLVVDTSLNISWTPSQNINNLTSGSAPFGVQQSHYNNISRDGGDQFKYIRGQGGPDGEVIYNALTNTWSGYTYTRNSGNKVPYANAVSANGITSFLGSNKLMTMYVNNNSGANFLDPYLEIH